ncbi:L-aminopeptidase/D-esterase-like protein [Actinokineospora baliensis]|uniref:hypothetical protein n=1 Tax=Actinokineospora baliensis TaxID=547056 RepID=UPI001EF9795F|nr:hypothetical protein [Actinokineospora baliensis]MBM7775559.1 L-aminopeptidase/D-esterase-like protein [Actinokineospora baliensis]
MTTVTTSESHRLARGRAYGVKRHRCCQGTGYDGDAGFTLTCANLCRHLPQLNQRATCGERMVDRLDQIR